MRYEDASQAGSITAGSDPIARADVETLPQGSNGPGTGNAISGLGTTTGASGADQVADGPATIVELRGVGGAAAPSGNGFEAAGQYGNLSMDVNGNFNYVRTTAADGVQDVFEYTLADAKGARSSTTLTVEIPRVIDEQAIVNLPAGVQMSDIRVVGRDLVIRMPDGTQMVIPGGAVFVPELTIGDVQVPPSNLAALLIDSEPQPAAGPPQSSGGNFADDVPPLDPGVPLGDLIPPTELDYSPPEYEEPMEIEDTEPTIIIITPDNPAGAVNATDSVDESGLPERPGEPEGTLEPQNIETTSGTIVFTADDGVETITINDVVVTTVGQQIQGEHGVLTITSINLATGEIGYTYTATDNTTDGVDDFEDFTVVVTDEDGDTATATLHIDILDDEPIARDDVDVVDLQTNTATGNVMTGVGTNAGTASGDTVGADDATLTAIEGEGGSDSSFDSNGNLVVDGEFGTLTIDAEGNYTYVPFDGAPGGTEDVFTYTLTDGDGDVITATLTIINPDQTPTAGPNPVVQLDDDVLGGNPGGPNDDPDSVNATGTLSGAGGDGQLTFDLLTTGAPAGFTYVDGPNGSILVQQVQDGVTVTVLTITVDPETGEYSVVQNANILHPDGQTENNVVFTINYTVTDGDGDVATSSLTINVDDDTPLAFDDTETMTENETQETGNVITGAGTNEGTGNADSPGADGFAGIVALEGANGSDSNPSGGFEVEGEFGTLVMDENGNYTYTRDPNSLEGGEDVFTYTYVDGDGDTVTATLTIVVPDIDLIPVANPPADVIIDDDDVAGAGGNPDGVDDDDPQNATGTLTATGGNGDVDFFFDVTATNNGLPTGFSLDPASTSTQLLIMQGTTLVMTITLNSETGEYTVVQNAPIDHAAGNDENNVDFDIIFYAQDADGSQSDPETLNISVDDDTPEADENGSVTGIVDEDDLPDGNDDNALGDADPTDPLNGAVVSGAAGSLDALFSPGADQPLTYSLNPDTSSLEAQNLTSGGETVNYVVVDGVVYAFTGDGDLDIDGIPTTGLVFTLEVNEDGSWEFTLLDQLDHAEGDDENDIDIDFSGMVIATDNDGDPATAAEGTFVVTVDDDLPVPDEEADPVTGLVDEDDLPDGNDDNALGDDDPGNADGDNDGTTTGGAAGSLSGLFSIGADQPGKIVVIDSAAAIASLEAQGLESGGDALSYDIDPVTGIVTGYVDDGDGSLDAGDAVIFTLTVNEDGSWEFDLEGQLDHAEGDDENDIDIDFSGVIGAVDEDGDPVEGELADGSFVVTVDDDLPTSNQADPITAIVDEDDLPNGIGDTTSPGDDDPGDADGDGDGTTASGTGLLDFANIGADQPGKVTLSTDTSGLPELTSNGEDVVYHVDADTGLLTAYVDDGDAVFDAGDTTIFTLQVNEDGSWEFDLEGQLDHDGDDFEDNIDIDFSSIIVITDEDGDPLATLPAESFVITVDDDIPTDFTPDEAIAENTGDDVVTGSLDSDVDGLDNNVGADQPGSIAFDIPDDPDGTPLLNTDGQQITVNGVAVVLILEDDGSITATTDPDDPNAKVFTATLDLDTSSYEITFFQQLDNGSTSASDFTGAPAGNQDWLGIDPDLVNGSAVDIEAANDPNDDSVDLLITAFDHSTRTATTVNRDADDIGAGTGQANDPDETLRIDFVQDLTRDPGQDEQDPGGYNFDEHVGQVVFSFTMVDTQSGGDAAVLIEAFNVTNEATSKTDVTTAANNVKVAIDPATIVVSVGGVPLVEGVDYDIYPDGTGGFYITPVPEGAVISFQAVGGVTFEAVEITNAAGHQIPGEAPGVEFEGEDFAIGGFSYGVNDPGDPVAFELPVELTDADGDTSQGTIDVTVYPEGQVPTSTFSSLMAEGSESQTQSADLSASVVPSNDNGAPVREFINANQAALMGAVAAAGLEMSGRISEVRAIVDDIRGEDMHASGSGQSAAVSGESNPGAAEIAVAAAASATAASEELSVQSGGAPAKDSPAGLDSANDDEAADLSALALGTDAQSDASDHASAMTAAAVAMPGAELVAALEAAASQSATAPAASSVAHNAEVGRVLADALAGGNGPDLEALVNALGGGDGGAREALQALAGMRSGEGTFDASALNFGNGHMALSMDALALHHDATPA